MTTEREEALELAREAGFWGQTWDKNYVESFIKLVRLAKQRGAEEQKRKDVEICRTLQVHEYEEEFYEDCAKAIEKQP